MTANTLLTNTAATNTMSTNDEFIKYDDELNAILREFHGALFKIIKIAETIDPKNYYITWVKQQIDIFRKIDKENIIKRAKNKFWHYRSEILKHDVAFFHTNQFGKFVKDDENKQFMYSLINMLKKKINDITHHEREVIWDLLENVLEACIKYKRLIGDYE